MRRVTPVTDECGNLEGAVVLSLGTGGWISWPSIQGARGRNEHLIIICNANTPYFTLQDEINYIWCLKIYEADVILS